MPPPKHVYFSDFLYYTKYRYTYNILRDIIWDSKYTRYYPTTLCALRPAK